MKRQDIKPIICVAHAAFDVERRKAFEPLRFSMGMQCAAAGVELFIYEDQEAKGSLVPWIRCLQRAAKSDATHFVFLPDDAVLVPNFVDRLLDVIAARPNDVICCQSNHRGAPVAYEAGFRWYSTPDGFTGFGGVLPIALVREHLEWRRTKLDPEALVQGDEGVNLWCMATRRLVYKPLPSLVQHDTKLKSLDGNDWHDTINERTSLVWEPDKDLERWWWFEKGRESVGCGRTYKGNQWRLVLDLREEAITAELVDAMYQAARHGEPVSETPTVAICCPTYREAHELVRATTPSRKAVVNDLLEHGYGVSQIKISGDSLPQRMRQRAMSEFLKSEATHLLFWDADVECLDPTVVRTMLESGHDVVCGAYPFKEMGSGRVVLNLWERDHKRFAEGEPIPTWLDVQHAGTGFMLVSRKAILRLIEMHPELLHLSQSTDASRFEPLWALFDTAVVDMAYLSEDYYFCHLWHEAGGSVVVYTPAKFRHYGVYGYEGGLDQQFAQTGT